jgi:hypothetical protein
MGPTAVEEKVPSSSKTVTSVSGAAFLPADFDGFRVVFQDGLFTYL